MPRFGKGGTTINVDVDTSAAESKLMAFQDRVKNSIAISARRTLGVMAGIASMTGTTIGSQLAMVFSAASLSARIYQSIASVELVSPTTAIFGALRSAQLTMLWGNIAAGLMQQGQINSELARTNMIVGQFATLLGGLL